MKNPAYHEVTTGKTGHYEAIEIIYDPLKISYAEIINVFWQNIDPTQTDGQFADKGSQYQTAIFYFDETQKKTALQSKKNLMLSGKFSGKIVTEILPEKPFFKAEEFHQKYYQKNKLHYKSYKKGSGRQKFLEETWKKES